MGSHEGKSLIPAHLSVHIGCPATFIGMAMTRNRASTLKRKKTDRFYEHAITKRPQSAEKVRFSNKTVHVDSVCDNWNVSQRKTLILYELFIEHRHLAHSCQLPYSSGCYANFFFAAFTGTLTKPIPLRTGSFADATGFFTGSASAPRLLRSASIRLTTLPRCTAGASSFGMGR